jgi:DNA primase
VATAGTALTEPHLKALSRFTGDIRLCFDADKAGMNATERAIPIASKVKVSLSVISIPSGKDPDELIKQDPAVWKAIIEKPQYALDWLMERYEQLLDITSAQGKREFSDVLLPVIKALTDPVEQDHYLRAIAERIDISMEALTTKLSQTVREEIKPLKRQKTALQPIDRQTVEYSKAQDHFLALVLLQPKLRDVLTPMTEVMFNRDEARQLLAFLQANPDFNGEPEKARGLSKIAEYVTILTLQYEELYSGLELTELRYEATRLQTRLVEQFVKTQKQNLAAELRDADESAAQTLLTEVKRLDALLNQVKST